METIDIGERYRDALLQRFLSYVKIETTSNKESTSRPSTPGQWALLHKLKDELESLGIADITLIETGYIIARVPPTPGTDPDCYIGFMAHVDTSPDCSGKNVEPRIHFPYDGKAIILDGGTVIDPEDFPELRDLKGHTLITSDGTTLLGADDKAGLSEIMTALEFFTEHPDIPRCGLELIFTTDEEIGTGMDEFPVHLLKSRACYTMDGDIEGSIEAECFNAYKVDVRFQGRVIHLGKARGKLVNAVSMAAAFINMLPSNESPEATDGSYGYFCPLEIIGGLEEARLEVYLRDFSEQVNLNRIARLEVMGRAVEAIFTGGTVTVESTLQYTNMADELAKQPHIMSYLETAIRAAGVSPERSSIRGGTDGARLTQMGIPTPNVFTGGLNYHSKRELASLDVMLTAVKTIIYLAGLWGVEKE